MKSAQVKTLRSRLTGGVTTASEICRQFATDAGVLTVTPAAVVVPASAVDVQEAVRYASEQSGKQQIELTPRGAGAGWSGGALTDGAVLALTPGLNSLLQLTKNTVTVEAGMSLATLQYLLRSHGRTVPGLPLDAAGTAGGAVAGGSLAVADQLLRVSAVLDDGSLASFRRISRRELNRKKGLMTREGDIYRGIDGLLEDHQAQLDEAAARGVVAGYRLARVGGGSSVDLSQLFVGSEGTLGIITEVTLNIAPLPDRTTLVAGRFESLEAAGEALHKLVRLKPACLQLVGQGALTQLGEAHPERLKALLGVDAAVPVALVWAEFDIPSHWAQNRCRRRATRIIGKHGALVRATHLPADQSPITTLADVAAGSLWGQSGGKPPLPLLDGAGVPADQLIAAIQQTTKLMSKHQTDELIWADALTGTLYATPALDLGKPKSRKTALKLLDEFAGVITGLGGALAPGSEGLIAAPYLEKAVGRDLMAVFTQVKHICDPHGVFTARPKLGVKKNNLDDLLRHEYAPARIRATI